MMSQNIIIKGRDNPVIFEFNFTGDFSANQLNTFTRITVTVSNIDGDSETYSTDLTPNQLFIVGGGQLRLKIGDTTTLEPGRYAVEIIGFSPTYDDGYELSGRNIPLLDKIRII